MPTYILSPNPERIQDLIWGNVKSEYYNIQITIEADDANSARELAAKKCMNPLKGGTNWENGTRYKGPLSPFLNEEYVECTLKEG